MLSALHRARLLSSPRLVTEFRTAATATAGQKREGDISDAFASLSGQNFKPLAPYYAHIKANLIRGYEDEVRESWDRLLRELREDIPKIVELGSNVIPEIDFSDIADGAVGDGFKEGLRTRGVAVVRGVVEEGQALAWKEELREYIRMNPQTKAFPADNPQVFELYWSRPQLKARSHPNLLDTQRFLMSFWHSAKPSAPISTRHPTIYADRLRMRLPGDAKFALGPHVDGGSVERWDPAGYGLGKVYSAIWKGRWEDFDPWEASCRLPVNPDLHQGVGACSMFRMYQGWLSLSTCGPGEGTLLVNPLLKKATAYYLLRPFFSPRKGVEQDSQTTTEALSSSAEFLHPNNWRLDHPQSSWIQGATPGHGQELNNLLHPHLRLPQTMIHIPTVQPGDYVAWHCDTIHAVDRIHNGATDSSVLYIPACPLTQGNAEFLVRQCKTFRSGRPSPDFGGGVGETQHVGRVDVKNDDLAWLGIEGLRGLGLKRWNREEKGLDLGEKMALRAANAVLGFGRK